MSSITGWFGSSKPATNSDEVELEAKGGSVEAEPEQVEAKLLPDMTDEEVEAHKFETAKKARRAQLDIIYTSESSLAATVASLKKSLMHYEKEKMDLYAKRQKYRIVVAKYKGPVDDVKLEAIKKILHVDLPNLIDEMDDRIIKGHTQLASLDRQLNDIRTSRAKAEKAYKRMFEPLPEGDLEENASDDSEEFGKDTPIEVILSRFDPINYPPPALPKDPYDTSSEDESDQHVEMVGDHSALVPPRRDPVSSSSGAQEDNDSHIGIHQDLVSVPLD